ncbi:MAG: hypothetical protein ACK56I_03880, partial [bacterium]
CNAACRPPGRRAAAAREAAIKAGGWGLSMTFAFVGDEPARNHARAQPASKCRASARKATPAATSLPPGAIHDLQRAGVVGGVDLGIEAILAEAAELGQHGGRLDAFDHGIL